MSAASPSADKPLADKPVDVTAQAAPAAAVPSVAGTQDKSLWQRLGLDRVSSSPDKARAAAPESAKHLEAAPEENAINDDARPMLMTAPNAADDAAHSGGAMMTPPEPKAEPVNPVAPAPVSGTTDSSLPSPQILKTLPPSRYDSRARDRQYYLVP